MTTPAADLPVENSDPRKASIEARKLVENYEIVATNLANWGAGELADAEYLVLKFIASLESEISRLRAELARQSKEANRWANLYAGLSSEGTSRVYGNGVIGEELHPCARCNGIGLEYVDVLPASPSESTPTTSPCGHSIASYVPFPPCGDLGWHGCVECLRLVPLPSTPNPELEEALDDYEGKLTDLISANPRAIAETKERAFTSRAALVALYSSLSSELSRVKEENERLRRPTMTAREIAETIAYMEEED